MTFESYNEKRAALMDEVDKLLKDGLADEAEAKMKDVEALDDQYDAVRKAEANARALSGQARKPIVPPVVPEQVVDTTAPDDPRETDPKEAYKTDAYRVAWAKTMMGQRLTDDESKIYQLANAEYTHTTENTGDVIPETVASGIWHEVDDMYPYFADITKTYVTGILTLIKGKESSDAAWYDEDTAVEDGTETFEIAQLSGCELARAITVSWKLKEMSMEDFIPYIQRRMAERLGAALGYGVTHGEGPDATKPEPTGIVTALVADGAQVVEYSDLAYTDITTARGLIKSAYANGLSIYANASTIWSVLANVIDLNKRPIFVNDPTAGGVYRILGLTVKEDASFADGEILISNASRGYQANINKQISVVTEDHAKQRTTDYVGYGIVDGAPLTLKAHALLTPAESGTSPASAKSASAKTSG